MLRVFAFLYCLFLLGFGFAQIESVENYTGLFCGDNIPADFTTSSTEKFKEDKEENQNKKLDRDFFIETRFIIDEMLSSGQVLFDETLSNYVSDVANYVLRENEELKSGLRFYVLKSSIPNAFSTDQGIIVIMTNLLSRLDNEAQLAFILAHEIVHYTESHVQDGYVERNKIAKGRGQYGLLSRYERIKKMSLYSQSDEYEADLGGLGFILNTDYAQTEVLSALRILKKADLPYEDIPFDKNFLQTEYIRIPDLVLSKGDPIYHRITEKELEFSTHPNINKRITKISRSKKFDSDAPGEKFIISEERFLEVRELSRFENIERKLMEREYVACLYDLFLMSKNYEDNYFLDLAYIQALYGLAKYSTSVYYNEVFDEDKKVYGFAGTLNKLMIDIKGDALIVLAYRHAFDMSRKYYLDPNFSLYEFELRKCLVQNTNLELKDFSKEPYDQYFDRVEVNGRIISIKDSLESIKKSNYEIAHKEILEENLYQIIMDYEYEIDEYDFHLFFLRDLIGLEPFEDSINSVSVYQSKKFDPYVFNGKEKIVHQEYEKVVVVDPKYKNFNVFKDKEYLLEERRKKEVDEFFMEGFEGLPIELQLLTSKSNSLTSKDYNDLGVLNNWSAEVISHDPDLNFVCSSRRSMNLISDDYKSKKFMFTGVFAFKAFDRADQRKEYLTYFAPLELLELLIVRNHFILVAFTIDSDNDQIEFISSFDVNIKSYSNILRHYYYNILYTLGSDK